MSKMINQGEKGVYIEHAQSVQMGIGGGRSVPKELGEPPIMPDLVIPRNHRVNPKICNRTPGYFLKR